MLKCSLKPCQYGSHSAKSCCMPFSICLRYGTLAGELSASGFQSKSGVSDAISNIDNYWTGNAGIIQFKSSLRLPAGSQESSDLTINTQDSCCSLHSRHEVVPFGTVECRNDQKYYQVR